MTTYRHKKRDTKYKMIGIANVQSDTPIKEGDKVAVYVGEGGDLWARPVEEFYDGRFEELDAD